MRNIMNISLPVDMMREVQKEVKKGHFASVSEYMRQLIRSDKLYRELEEQEKDFAAGKGILLKSLKDLD